MADSILLQNLNTADLTQLIKDGVKSQLKDFKETFNTHNPDELLTRTETCKFLQIDSSTLWHWTNKGKVIAYGIGNRRYYKKAELLESLKELITNDIVKLSENFEHLEKTTDDILQELSNSISKIDFEILAFPDIETVKKQIEDLKEFVYNEDGTYNKDNKAEFDKYKKLNKRLTGYKLSKNHYLVLCIEQLLKIAKANNWGLCKKNGFIYLYNGCYWSEINKESFQSFLGNVSSKMSYLNSLWQMLICQRQRLTKRMY